MATCRLVWRRESRAMNDFSNIVWKVTGGDTNPHDAMNKKCIVRRRETEGSSDGRRSAHWVDSSLPIVDWPSQNRGATAVMTYLLLGGQTRLCVQEP